MQMSMGVCPWRRWMVRVNWCGWTYRSHVFPSLYEHSNTLTVVPILGSRSSHSVCHRRVSDTGDFDAHSSCILQHYIVVLLREIYTSHGSEQTSSSLHVCNVSHLHALGIYHDSRPTCCNLGCCKSSHCGDCKSRQIGVDWGNWGTNIVCAPRCSFGLSSSSKVALSALVVVEAG